MRPATSIWIFFCLIKILVGLNNKKTPVIEIMKGLSRATDSSCGFILHTKEQINYNRSTITDVAFNLAADFSMDLTITALEFQTFLSNYMNQKDLLSCKSPILIVLHDDEGTRKQLSHISSYIALHDFCTIIFTNQPLESWFQDMLTPFSAFIVVAQELNSEYVNLLEIYRVAPEYPLRAPTVGNWTSSHGFYMHGDVSNVYNRRHDLEGIVLKTGSTENKPIHSFQLQPNGRHELVGYFPEVWKELETLLNFTSVHFRSVDGASGIQEEDGIWNGLIGMLLRNEIDVALSEFIMDTHRTHVVEFTRPLMKSSFQIFFLKRGTSYNWDAILKPFSSDTWIALFTWMFMASIFLATVNKLCHLYSDIFAEKFHFTFIASFFFHLQAICSQGHTVVPQSIACRIIFISAYLVNCILSPSYSAYLISYLTFRTPNRPFDNLQGFLDDGTYKLLTNAKSAEFTYFSAAGDSMLQRIYNEQIIKEENKLPITTEDALNRICQNPQLAYFGDALAAQVHVLKQKNDNDCDIVTLSQSISTIYASMAVRKRSPYRMILGHYLQKMVDTGIINRAFLKSFPLETDSASPSNYVEVTDVLQTFLLLAVGGTISVILLLFEIIHFQRRQQKIRKVAGYRLKVNENKANSKSEINNFAFTFVN